MAEIKDATKPLKFKLVAGPDAPSTETGSLIPVYRVKGNQRRLMGWAERSERLRGAMEIRMNQDNAEVVYSKSDA